MHTNTESAPCKWRMVLWLKLCTMRHLTKEDIRFLNRGCSSKLKISERVRDLLSILGSNSKLQGIDYRLDQIPAFLMGMATSNHLKASCCCSILKTRENKKLIWTAKKKPRVQLPANPPTRRKWTRNKHQYKRPKVCWKRFSLDLDKAIWRIPTIFRAPGKRRRQTT